MKHRAAITFRLCRNYNIKTAANKVKKGKSRIVNTRFAALASHYLFDPDFCNVASGWGEAGFRNASVAQPTRHAGRAVGRGAKVSPFSQSGGALLFHLLSKLYEHTSVIITTNLTFGEWASVFGACLSMAIIGLSEKRDVS